MNGWTNFDPRRFIRDEAPSPAEGAPTPSASVQQPASDAIRGTVPGIRERDYRDLPRDWAAGLRRMNTMDMPRGARRERWAELVLDAHRFAWGWQREAIEQGWTLETLFGFNPKEPFQDQAGLAFSIRGSRVLSLFKDDRDRAAATIGKGAEQGYRSFYRRPVENAQLIWTARAIG